MNDPELQSLAEALDGFGYAGCPFSYGGTERVLSPMQGIPQAEGGYFVSEVLKHDKPFLKVASAVERGCYAHIREYYTAFIHDALQAMG